MIEGRLHQVPRYRQKLAFPPLAQARPVWIDDPHFNLATTCATRRCRSPRARSSCGNLAGRVFSQQLDRSKPLWEIWLVNRVGDDRFGLVCKTHHALVDGISGVDIMTVLFDLEPEPPEAEPGPPWYPRPEPSGTMLFADAMARLRRRAARRRASGRGRGCRTRAGRPTRPRAPSPGSPRWPPRAAGAPPSPLNTRIGPHRRFAWTESGLDRFKAIKDALGGTVNDVVSGRGHRRAARAPAAPGRPTEDLELKAMVPVSVRTDDQRGELGNQVAAIYAPLPVGIDDPLERFRTVHEALGDLKSSAQAIGAERLTQLAGFAAPTLLDQAATAAVAASGCST